jgi:hypothetical protein
MAVSSLRFIGGCTPARHELHEPELGVEGVVARPRRVARNVYCASGCLRKTVAHPRHVLRVEVPALLVDAALAQVVAARPRLL